MHISIALLIAIIAGAAIATLLVQKPIRSSLVPHVREGDIALYVDPASPPHERNIVTEVLAVFPNYGTAIIRSTRTTTVVFQKNLQVLHLDRAFPLRVPEKPKAVVSMPDPGDLSLPTVIIQEGDTLPPGARGVCSPGNEAEFHSVPLNWFRYGISFDNDGRLCAV